LPKRKKKDFVRLSVSIDRQLYEKIEELIEKGMAKSKTDVVEAALNFYLNNLDNEFIPIPEEIKLLWNINQINPNLFGAKDIPDLIRRLVYSYAVDGKKLPEHVSRMLLSLIEEGEEFLV